MRRTDILPVKGVAVIALLVASVLVCAPTYAQSATEGLRIGNFSVVLKTDSVTGADSSFAVLSPNGEETGALVVFACGADHDALAVGFMLPVPGTREATLRIVLRSDESEGDTLVLTGQEGRFLWYAGDSDIAAVMLRAQTAGQMSIQILGNSTARPSAQATFTLSGLDSVLRRLDCSMTPPLPAKLVGREIIQSNFGATGYWDVPPRLINHSEFAGYLQQNYPPELWYAGLESRTVVRFRILESGFVDSANAYVLQSADPAFDAVALNGLRRAQFHPASLNGKPVAAWVTLPIHFTLPRTRPRNVADLTRYIDEHYPVPLRDSGVGGLVILNFQVLRNGRVEASSIRVRFSSHELFNEIAIRAVQELRFSAPEFGVDWVTMPVIFSPPSTAEPRTSRPEGVRPTNTAPSQVW